jgi:hypothetical protein
MSFSQAGDGLRDVRKGGLPFGRQNNVKCQVGMKIAGQIKRPRQIGPAAGRSIQIVRVSVPAPVNMYMVCGPGSRMPGLSNWVSFVGPRRPIGARVKLERK